MNDNVKNHLKRQFKGYLWFSDYYDRKPKEWITDNSEMPVGKGDTTLETLEILRKMVGKE